MPTLEISGRLRFASPLFIGAGAGQPGVDKSTITEAGQPFIPGASLKGRVRHHCERIARALRIWVCEGPQPERMCPQPQLNRGQAEAFCPICELFGSPWRRSPLIFEDWLLQRPAEVPQEIWAEWLRSGSLLDQRWGVALNRRRRTAQPDKLFVLAPVKAGLPAEWQGRITGVLPREELAALLYAGVLALRTLGGDNSRGLGWLEQATVEGLTILWNGEKKGGREWLVAQLQRLAGGEHV